MYSWEAAFLGRLVQQMILFHVVIRKYRQWSAGCRRSSSCVWSPDCRDFLSFNLLLSSGSPLLTSCRLGKPCLSRWVWSHYWQRSRKFNSMSAFKLLLSLLARGVSVSCTMFVYLQRDGTAKAKFVVCGHRLVLFWKDYFENKNYCSALSSRFLSLATAPNWPMFQTDIVQAIFPWWTRWCGCIHSTSSRMATGVKFCVLTLISPTIIKPSRQNRWSL